MASANSSTFTESSGIKVQVGVEEEIDVESQLPPPQYDSVVMNNAPTLSLDSPPTYDSLFAKLKRAKEDSSNPFEYVSKACGIMCGSVLITIMFAISAALPAVMIVIGAIYINDCPINNKIPIWLVVSGAFGLLSAIIRTSSNCYTLYKKRNDENYEMHKKSCLTAAIEFFLFAWFICGNVWVYSVKNVVIDDPTMTGTYCHPTCYYFAFWIITVTWIFMGLLCCCCCCILTIAGCGLGVVALKEVN
jgi:hypothetical protein